MLDLVRKATRTILPAALVLPVLILSVAFGSTSALADSIKPLPPAIALPSDPVVVPPADYPSPTFLFTVKEPRPDDDILKFKAEYPETLAIVPQATAEAAAFCSTDQRKDFLATYIAPRIASASGLSGRLTKYRAALAVALTNVRFADDKRKTFLTAEVEWAHTWENFADGIVTSLRDTERQLSNSPVIECRSACDKSIVPWPLTVAADGGQHLPGRSFKYESGEPGDPRYFAMNVTVRPGIGCRNGTVGVGVFGGHGEATQLNYFTYEKIAGTIPGYPDIYPETQVKGVIFKFKGGGQKPAPIPAYEVQAPKAPLESIQMMVNNGHEVITLTWS